MTYVYALIVLAVLGGALVRVFGTAPQEPAEAAETPADSCDTTTSAPSRVVAMLRYGFVTLPADIGRSLIIGLLLAGLITVFVQPEWFANTFGRGFGAMVAMLLVGIPFYVCATASVPLALAMIAHQGVSPGAALVFLMTGPATNAATITTIWKIMGRRAAVLYVVAVMVTALASGLLLDGMFPSIAESVTAGHQHAAEHGAGWVPTASGIALVLVLLPAVAGPIAAKWRSKRRKEPHVSDANSLVLTIEGMTCSHCAATVERTLGECAGVESAKVDLAAGEAKVTGEGLDAAALCEAVGAVGYTARESAEVGVCSQAARPAGRPMFAAHWSVRHGGSPLRSDKRTSGAPGMEGPVLSYRTPVPKFFFRSTKSLRSTSRSESKSPSSHAEPVPKRTLSTAKSSRSTSPSRSASPAMGADAAGRFSEISDEAAYFARPTTISRKM